MELQFSQPPTHPFASIFFHFFCRYCNVIWWHYEFFPLCFSKMIRCWLSNFLLSFVRFFPRRFVFFHKVDLYQFYWIALHCFNDHPRIFFGNSEKRNPINIDQNVKEWFGIFSILFYSIPLCSLAIVRCNGMFHVIQINIDRISLEKDKR